MSLNCSDPRSHPRTVLTSMHYFTFICYSICFCIAFVGNGTMFLILIRNQRVKVRRVYTLLLHMNIAHLIVTFFYMPKEVIHSITVAWWGGDFAVLFRTSNHPCAEWFTQCVSGDFVGAVSRNVVFAYTIANLAQVRSSIVLHYESFQYL
ncbi:unnamed protein product [Onchocerca ochengi]|uniref:G_PROTEIN_RECEP_F1_2 domain-containing protein n=1 Tax=Onchocerca ochengi TaxID=42157 RepID=A0A182EDA1_ONCOC|nr:unnamed protein product [Onchocerca ochengi]